jgi:hypothetical protein
MEYVIFDQDWLDVPIQDYPVGGLAVCHDPQKRLGEITWAVVRVDSPALGPLSALTVQSRHRMRLGYSGTRKRL